MVSRSVTLVCMAYGSHAGGIVRSASLLAAMGHRVTVICPRGSIDPRRFSPEVTCVSGREAGEDHQPTTETIAELRDVDRRVELLRGDILDGLEAAVDLVASTISTTSSDLVITDPMEAAGAIAATRARIPWIALATDLSLASLSSENDPFVAACHAFDPILAEHVQRLGYDGRFRNTLVVSPHDNLVPGIEAWLDPGLLRTRSFGHAGTTATPVGLERRMPGAPLVVIAFGTIVQLPTEFLQLFCQAAAELPQVEFLFGAPVEPGHTLQVPSNMTHDVFIPQAAAASTAAVVLHHGGAGSFLEAIAVGVPQVVSPLHSDQFCTAHVLRKNALGTVVDAASLTTADIVDAIERELTPTPARAEAILSTRRALATLNFEREVESCVRNYLGGRSPS